MKVVLLLMIYNRAGFAFGEGRGTHFLHLQRRLFNTLWFLGFQRAIPFFTPPLVLLGFKTPLCFDSGLGQCRHNEVQHPWKASPQGIFVGMIGN